MKHKVFLALGSNLGQRLDNLQAAVKALTPEVRVLQESRVYETEPWGYADQPSFLNMVLGAETELSPQKLLAKLKKVELNLGRIPNFRNGPRLIDLDILFYDDLILNLPDLVIPHPRLSERAFVLVPLMDLAPGLIHPATGQSVAELARKIDTSGVVLFRD